MVNVNPVVAVSKPEPARVCLHAYSRQMLPKGQVRKCLKCKEPDPGLSQSDYPVGISMTEGVDLEL